MTNPHAQKIRAFLKDQEELEKLRTPGEWVKAGSGLRQLQVASYSEIPGNRLILEMTSWNTRADSNLDMLLHAVNNAEKMRKLAEELVDSIVSIQSTHSVIQMQHYCEEALEQAAKILDEP